MKTQPTMNSLPRTIATAAGALALCLCLTLPHAALAVDAVSMPPASAEVPMLDPWVPPALRDKAAPASATQGAALRQQVEQKLKQGFDAADAKGLGTLTREQARAAGLGYVEKHFDEIDRRKTGAVRFDDIKHYLRERGAQLD